MKDKNKKRQPPPPKKKERKEGDKNMSQDEAVFWGERGKLLLFEKKEANEAKTKVIQDVCLKRKWRAPFCFGTKNNETKDNTFIFNKMCVIYFILVIITLLLLFWFLFLCFLNFSFLLCVCVFMFPPFCSSTLLAPFCSFAISSSLSCAPFCHSFSCLLHVCENIFLLSLFIIHDPFLLSLFHGWCPRLFFLFFFFFFFFFFPIFLPSSSWTSCFF